MEGFYGVVEEQGGGEADFPYKFYQLFAGKTHGVLAPNPDFII
jgi:hypothetical protein